MDRISTNQGREPSNLAPFVFILSILKILFILSKETRDQASASGASSHCAPAVHPISTDPLGEVPIAQMGDERKFIPVRLIPEPSVSEEQGGRGRA